MTFWDESALVLGFPKIVRKYEFLIPSGGGEKGRS